METKEYGVLDFDGIWNLARDYVAGVFIEGMMLDDEGNWIGAPDNTAEWFEKRDSDSRFKYLNFRECEELRSITLGDATDLSIEEIMEKYLYDAVPFIRTVMRKGSLDSLRAVKSDVPDEYLDQIICNAWKVDLITMAALLYKDH